MEEGSVFFDWEHTGTELAENLTDEILLEHVKNAEILRGWGTVAEVCKRFKRLIKEE
jgi:hypothetical protein